MKNWVWWYSRIRNKKLIKKLRPWLRFCYISMFLGWMDRHFFVNYFKFILFLATTWLSQVVFSKLVFIVMHLKKHIKYKVILLRVCYIISIHLWEHVASLFSMNYWPLHVTVSRFLRGCLVYSHTQSLSGCYQTLLCAEDDSCGPLTWPSSQVQNWSWMAASTWRSPLFPRALLDDSSKPHCYNHFTVTLHQGTTHLFTGRHWAVLSTRLSNAEMK